MSDEALAQTTSGVTSETTGITYVVCLQLGLFEDGKHISKDKECWMDRNGEDILEGYTGTCLISGSGCHPGTCNTEMDGCFEREPTP